MDYTRIRPRLRGDFGNEFLIHGSRGGEEVVGWLGLEPRTNGLKGRW